MPDGKVDVAAQLPVAAQKLQPEAGLVAIADIGVAAVVEGVDAEHGFGDQPACAAAELGFPVAFVVVVDDADVGEGDALTGILPDGEEVSK